MHADCPIHIGNSLLKHICSSTIKKQVFEVIYDKYSGKKLLLNFLIKIFNWFYKLSRAGCGLGDTEIWVAVYFKL